MEKNTYKQDEVLEEPFDIKHLLRCWAMTPATSTP